MATKEKHINNLRKRIIDVIYNKETFDSIPDVCKSLKLSLINKPENIGKRPYVDKIVSNTDDSQIFLAAKQMLVKYPSNRVDLTKDDLFFIQNEIWWIENQGVQEISTVTRTRILESLEDSEFWGRLGLPEFFQKDFPFYGLPEIGKDGKLYSDLSMLAAMAFFQGKKTLNMQPTRITILKLLKKHGLEEWPDQRFCQFIERVVHPEVQRSEQQEKFVDLFNELLKPDGFELNEVDREGGVPVYRVRKINYGVQGAPKYLIFASVGFKPDIVIDNAVNMDIRIVQNAENCLIYDEIFPDDDLTWDLLLKWWGKKNNQDYSDKEVRRAFGKRLQSSLQSPPEILFFNTYFKKYRKKLGKNLPALIPQVYLHYDPKNLNERGNPIFIHQRMDFLMLLRSSTRIVIEIDGKQHYSDELGIASPKKYANMVSDDRNNKLNGYEIYRFGGAEFIDDQRSSEVITTFFDRLFYRFKIINIE